MLRLNVDMTMEKTDDGELILYDPSKEMMHILNRTAADIIGFIQDNSCITPFEIGERIKELYKTICL